jgi:diadenylate cyclase
MFSKNILGWVPVIEILVLFLVFYALLRFVRGTRGAGVLKGVIIIFAVVFVALLTTTEQLGLLRITGLLQWLLQFSILALIVVFMPEIRHGLLKLGQSPIFRVFMPPPSHGVIEEVVTAAHRMHRTNTGALIALEREVSLNQYVEGGVPLNADVTSELIETVFYSGSALHDGAIIIRNERLVAASCLFPLTENPEISKSMGTRHRAAIGLTEETDAICIVVSEETGRISLAVRGRMSTDLDREALEKALAELYVRDEQPREDTTATAAEEAALAQGTEVFTPPETEDGIEAPPDESPVQVNEKEDAS